MKQIQQVKVVDAIKNGHWCQRVQVIGGIVNRLPWVIALTNGHMQIGGGHRFHSQTHQAYTQESKNTPSNHTLKIFQIVDVALGFIQHNCIDQNGIFCNPNNSITNTKPHIWFHSSNCIQFEMNLHSRKFKQLHSTSHKHAFNFHTSHKLVTNFNQIIHIL